MSVQSVIRPDRLPSSPHSLLYGSSPRAWGPHLMAPLTPERRKRFKQKAEARRLLVPKVTASRRATIPPEALPGTLGLDQEEFQALVDARVISSSTALTLVQTRYLIYGYHIFMLRADSPDIQGLRRFFRRVKRRKKFTEEICHKNL